MFKETFYFLPTNPISIPFIPHTRNPVHSARGVLIKGKGGLNNCFVTIGLGKEKFQTSVQKNASANVEWREECELYVPNTLLYKPKLK